MKRFAVFLAFFNICDFPHHGLPVRSTVIDVNEEPELSSALAAKLEGRSSDSECWMKGEQPCSTRCDQGKLYQESGCCICVCKKNYVNVNLTSCVRALWSEWSSWGFCIETEWGGLQTKERVCKYREMEAPGSCDGRGSRGRTCSHITKEFRIRKNLKDLSDEEFHDFIQAMTKFKKDKTKRGYRNIISWHGWPGRCPWYKHRKPNARCSWHHHPLFLPWHRIFTVQLELGLSRYLQNKTLGIPFWDWTEHTLDLPYIIRHPVVYDPILKKYVDNPFYSSFIKSIEGEKLYSHRDPWYPGVLMDDYLIKGTIRALLCHDYSKFDDQESYNPHDQIHNCMCHRPATKETDFCEYSLRSPAYAAWDPAFLIHHSAVDRYFVMRRVLEESEGVADWTKSRVIGQYSQFWQSSGRNDSLKDVFDFPLSPFCNQSMNPESATGRDATWTMHYSYYDAQLFGYKYTDFNLGGKYAWDDLRRDYRKNVIERKFWNDEYFETKLGPVTLSTFKLTKERVMGCLKNYSSVPKPIPIIQDNAGGEKGLQKTDRTT